MTMNGNGPIGGPNEMFGMPGGQPGPMQMEPNLPPPPSPSQITEWHDSQERSSQERRQRMEEDWALITLQPYDAGDGYQAYTSNEPRVYWGKMISLLASGSINIRMPSPPERRDQRERETAKENFLYGNINSNDERLMLIGEPLLLDQLVAFTCSRGWNCGRALLVKDPETNETYTDITPYDPLHTTWSFGRKGLNWICNKCMKTPMEVLDEYGYRMPGFDPTRPSYSGDDGDIAVYDWLDGVYNIVVINGEYAKQPTPHGSPRTPGFINAVDYLPLIQSWSGTGTTTGMRSRSNVIYHGESVFESTRDIYSKMNLVYSTMLQLVDLSRNQAWSYTTRDGTKTLDENPSLAGSQVPLAEGESINILPLLEMSRDTGVFLSVISGEVQRGNLPYSVYGQLAFQLSGYAVKLLGQAQEAPIAPRQKAVTNAYKQIFSLISDQYATRSFEDGFFLSGMANNRDWFEIQFSPEQIQGLGQPDVQLVIATPQDEMQRMEMAIKADQAKLLPRRVIRDEFLNRNDVDEIESMMLEQEGKEILPASKFYVVGRAMLEMGEEDLAMQYLRMAAMMDVSGTIGSALGGTVPGPNAAGVSPNNLSAPEQGAPNPEPTPQAGPNVPPGTPRPGARGG